ncbi:CORIN [Lepeophtheirus salmonis]|uniref:CORIN n=1 Tax=Lepeophtheirus salmonis TaxID=72036 RepID=A0A817FAZ6_LEPSM|nr:CORIN [Lepeophtheirus salmonis]CAG9476151.1 CORIN [Lepeophtheirus salmonis]
MVGVKTGELPGKEIHFQPSSAACPQLQHAMLSRKIIGIFNTNERKCLKPSEICDGIPHCGDMSDERDDLTDALQTLKPESICDGNIDCVIEESDFIGSDESSKQCCHLKKSYPVFPGHASGDCRDGADDEDCLSISVRDSSYSEDTFGRPKSRPQGYLHCIAYGKRYLYCAGQHFYGLLEYDSDLRMKAVEILCRNEGYHFGGELTFFIKLLRSTMYILMKMRTISHASLFILFAEIVLPKV